MASALENLIKKYNAKIAPSIAELEAWNAIDPVAQPARLMSGRLRTDNTVVTTVGLFHYPLDDFLAECAILEVDFECWV